MHHDAPPPDLYRHLKVPPTADAALIRKAFRRLALKYHPDKNHGNPSAVKLFRVLRDSYAVLSDPQARAAYDAVRSAFDTAPVSAARTAPDLGSGFTCSAPLSAAAVTSAATAAAAALARDEASVLLFSSELAARRREALANYRAQLSRIRKAYACVSTDELLASLDADVSPEAALSVTPRSFRQSESRVPLGADFSARGSSLTVLVSWEASVSATEARRFIEVLCASPATPASLLAFRETVQTTPASGAHCPWAAVVWPS
eukprot:gnl/Ergobibamus_cyprinoides/4228.p2 GENE.gnl/Ergobibamus_cyprinoides/4228~~gnl/Ergobibamus_cyprinoides/4228.p2  ORF type:complete len:261 (+),score=27.97 gnl/Ergobibamus_cyprinoides/4228:2-784(+)